MPNKKTNTPKEENKIPESEVLKKEIKDVVNTDEEKENINDLKKRLLEQQKKIDMLLEIADKKSLSHYYDKNAKALPTLVKIRKLDGKIVLG
jgi:divalent metal cation (Fe/Co/Zn/Cd) transporter